ncbi:MAG: class I fructose-bisphosphate aldolase family protein [Methanomassiliicoccales archaeon]|nr:MAG: class I fructose-bisphosphate aldolase family protein [Methanomassiliicoccales archaeon]
MSELGKSVRLRRIGDAKGRFVIVPMDHGVSSGPISGIIDMEDTVGKVAEGGATAVVLHKGMAGSIQRFHGDIGFILHLSASTKLGPDPNAKVLVTSVEEALQMGADSVSIHVNVGCETEGEMLSDLGFISSACREWGVPLLAMMYPRGPEIKDPFDVELVKHAARLGAELGADIIKTNYTGTVDTFKEVISGCPKPIIIAGGPKVDSDRDVLKMVFEAKQAGCAGMSIGRNVFQHENIVGMTRALAKIILEDMEVDEAYKLITG